MQEERVSIPAREAVVEVQGLTKSFGSRLVLRGIDLKIEKGQFLTIFGPNGAGKTTLIKVLATLAKPSSGQIRVAGLQLPGDGPQVRGRLGVVSHQTLLYGDLTAYENLQFYGRMYSIPDPGRRIGQVLEWVGMEGVAQQRVGTMSHGMQKRISIARAVLHDPEVLLLDEPEAGLDQQAASLLSELLDAVCGGERTVIMTTHNLERGLHMGDRVAILSRGRIVFDEAREQVDLSSFPETYGRYTLPGR